MDINIEETYVCCFNVKNLKKLKFSGIKCTKIIELQDYLILLIKGIELVLIKGIIKFEWYVEYTNQKYWYIFDFKNIKDEYTFLHKIFSLYQDKYFLYVCKNFAILPTYEQISINEYNSPDEGKIYKFCL